jgi:outer membrane protein assembly factor BamA
VRFRFFLLVFFIGYSLSGFAQTPAASGSSSVDSLISCPGETVIIDSIIVNGLRKTKRYIVLSELDLQPGIQLQPAELEKRLEQNRARVFNLQLFVWVKARVASCDAGRAVLEFTVQERWYLWPVPIFSLADRNFNAWWDKRDFSRVDYGLHLVQYNFRGRNEELKMNLQHGFNRKYEILYQSPGRWANRRLGLTTGVSWYQSHSLDYITTQDRPLTYRNDNEFPIQRFYVTAGLIHRKTIERQTVFQLYYHHQQISDSVQKLNPDYFREAGSRQMLQFKIGHHTNFRRTFAYPLAGRYFSWEASQWVPLGRGSSSFTQLWAKYAWYRPLRNRFYYSIGVAAQTKLSRTLAYADNQSLGYANYVRGYELSVIDGQHYGLLMQGLSYAILPEHTIHLKFLKNPRFNRIPLSILANLFFDAGISADRFYYHFNPATNELVWGTGLGLHFVTYYDRVLTVEYTVNKALQRGLYLRATFPF